MLGKLKFSSENDQTGKNDNKIHEILNFESQSKIKSSLFPLTKKVKKEKK